MHEEFDIVRAKGIRHLIDSVNAKLKVGWVLSGSYIVDTSSAGGGEYQQPIVRHVPSPEDEAPPSILNGAMAQEALGRIPADPDAALAERNMWKANHDNQVKMKRSIEGANRALIDERTELHLTYGIELGKWRAVVSKIAAAVPATCDNLDDAVRIGDEVSAFLARVAKVQKQAARDQAYLYKLVNAEDGGVLLGRFEEQTTEQVIRTLNTLVAGVH